MQEGHAAYSIPFGLAEPQASAASVVAAAADEADREEIPAPSAGSETFAPAPAPVGVDVPVRARLGRLSLRRGACQSSRGCPASCVVY